MGTASSQQGSQPPSGERRKPWSGAEFSQAEGGQEDWHRAGNIPGPLRNQLQGFRGAKSEGTVTMLSFPVMIYLIKLCLKISLAGGLFSAGPGRGWAQSAAS